MKLSKGTETAMVNMKYIVAVKNDIDSEIEDETKNTKSDS